MTLLDDLAPEALHRWDAAVLERLRLDKKSETLFFEFKSTFDCDAVEKTVCAFANRLGGFLLHGVTTFAGDNTIDAFVGVDPGTEWIRRVADCVVGHISPLPSWDTVQIPSPDVPSRFVVVTRVEASSRTPHLVARTGRMYVRSPAGSDPVSDKATLDLLMERGAGGRGLAQVRADRLHSDAPGTELIYTFEAISYKVQIAVVPTPQLGDEALASLLTHSGRTNSGSIFAHPSVRSLRPKGHREDRVLFVGGRQAGARMTDGSIFSQETFPNAYLAVGPIVNLARGMLQAASFQEPPVRQVLIDVRVLGASAVQVDEDGTGRNFARLPLGTNLWHWAVETGTTHEAAERTSLALGRRLWRTVGDDRGLEPE